MSDFTAVRLNVNAFPVSDLERKYIFGAGISRLVEIDGDTPEDIIRSAENADVLYVVSAKVGRDVVQGLKKCRIICRMGIGVDKIDLQAATEKGIIVTNIPDFCGNELAEHAMALLLGVTRNLVQLDQKMRAGEWISARKNAKFSRMAGKTLGLVGFGNIGKEIALRAAGFKLHILDYHRNVNPEVEKAYGVEPVSLEKLLTESDYVIVACPLSSETRGMIGRRELAMMKQSAILVNIARGPIIDEEALVEALQAKRIAGAGIDVYGQFDVFREPERPFANPLFDLDNVVLSPHIASASVESAEEGLAKANENVARVLAGFWPRNCVNPEVKPWFEIH
jgi:D-3-phosphoglycerate dehydrogenase / 2-oxoglutarate reductase